MWSLGQRLSAGYCLLHSFYSLTNYSHNKMKANHTPHQKSHVVSWRRIFCTPRILILRGTVFVSTISTFIPSFIALRICFKIVNNSIIIIVIVVVTSVIFVVVVVILVVVVVVVVVAILVDTLLLLLLWSSSLFQCL